MLVLNHHEWLLKEAETFFKSQISYKEEWGAYCFLVGNKIFGMIGKNKEKQLILTVKGIPEKNLELREAFSFISTGYYMNKQHWISIKLENEQVTVEMIKKLLDNSYRIIYEGLSKKEKSALQTNPNKTL